MRLFKQTFPLLRCASERTFLVAEDFAMQETVIWEYTAVDNFERFSTSQARFMYLMRYNLFANTRVPVIRIGTFVRANRSTLL